MPESVRPDPYRLRQQIIEQRIIVPNAVGHCELLVKQGHHATALQRGVLPRPHLRALCAVRPCVRCQDHQRGATCGSPRCQMQGGDASQGMAYPHAGLRYQFGQPVDLAIKIAFNAEQFDDYRLSKCCHQPLQAGTVHERAGQENERDGILHQWDASRMTDGGSRPNNDRSSFAPVSDYGLASTQATG